MMDYAIASGFSPFYLMAKPVGPACNLGCTYCYYLDKGKLYPREGNSRVMSDEMLEKFIAQYIYSSNNPAVLFTWHGGEPLMRGLEFFKKAVRLQHQYAGGRVVENSIQTNGTLLTDDWCSFFHDHGFLVGLSIDGPEHCHDRYRKDASGRPSFAKVMAGLELLKKHRVEFNTLSVVNRYNVKFPLEVYRFLKGIGSRYMQFTPIVETVRHEGGGGDPAQLPPGFSGKVEVSDESVDPVEFGKFLTGVFDEWVRRDVGTCFVVTFDCILANWMRVPPPLCIHAETCGHAGVVEFNGDVYSCDHFVFPGYRLGNISEKSLMTLMRSEFQQRFGLDKRDSLPGWCKKCEYLDLCRGECPKNRFLHTPDGEPGLNYLCRGYKFFYRHAEPFMDFMANEILHDRTPSNVMKWAGQQPGRR